MILSPTLQSIPACLVRRIQEGEFIMRELLADNITLHDQLEAIQDPVMTQTTPRSLRPTLHEIPFIAFLNVLLCCIRSCLHHRPNWEKNAGLQLANHTGGTASWLVQVAGLWQMFLPTGINRQISSLECLLPGLQISHYSRSANTGWCPLFSL